MKKIAMLFIILLLGGCAIGNTTSYQGTSSFKPKYNMPPVALAVIDKRPYVLDGEKNPSYSGTQRSLGGIPYNVNTASGKPLAEDLQGLVGNTLRKHGVLVDDMPLLPMDITESDAIKKTTAGKLKAILLFLNEWRTHIYFNPIFYYDMKMLVVDTNANILSTAINKGTKEFGDDKELKNFGGVVTVVFDELFNDEKIKFALLADESRLPSQLDKEKVQENIVKEPPSLNKMTKEEPKCTTDQILKMKEMGMSNSQIKAACE